MCLIFQDEGNMQIWNNNLKNSHSWKHKERTTQNSEYDRQFSCFMYESCFISKSKEENEQHIGHMCAIDTAIFPRKMT